MAKCTFKPQTNFSKHTNTRYANLNAEDDIAGEDILTTEMWKKNFEKYIKENFDVEDQDADPDTCEVSKEDDQGSYCKVDIRSLAKNPVSQPEEDKNLDPKVEGEPNNLPEEGYQDPNVRDDPPILFLDVNFGNNKLTRIVMYKGKSLNSNPHLT